MNNTNITKKSAGQYTFKTQYYNGEISRCGSTWSVKGEDINEFRYFEYFYSFKDAKKDVYSLDAFFEEQEKLKQEKLAAEEELYQWEKIESAKLQKSVILPKNAFCKFSKKVNKGDKVNAFWGLGKENNLGEALFNIFKNVEYTQKLNKISDYHREPIMPTTRLVEIGQKIEITNEEYDSFVKDLLVDFSGKFASCKEYGGSTSDYENKEQYENDYWAFFEEARKPQYNPRSIATLVTSKNRLSLLINSEGYNYARYVGVVSSKAY